MLFPCYDGVIRLFERGGFERFHRSLMCELFHLSHMRISIFWFIYCTTVRSVFQNLRLGSMQFAANIYADKTSDSFNAHVDA